MPLALAFRYAKALADLVMTPGSEVSPRAALAELDVFEKLFAVTPELRNVLLSPAVPPVRKRALIRRLAELAGISRVVRNFLGVVIDHRRTLLIPEIVYAFRLQIDERMGEVEANVASARELTQDQKDAIRAELASLTGKKARCRFAVDQSLIGGVRAKIGSTIYDGSVRGQLERLRRKLME
jgi:F-type H+-transporting ATPase subunit delta